MSQALALQLSLIEDSEAVKTLLEKQDKSNVPEKLVAQLMEHAVATENILKSHYTPGTFHRNGQLYVPFQGYESFASHGDEVKPNKFASHEGRTTSPARAILSRISAFLLSHHHAKRRCLISETGMRQGKCLLKES